MKQLLAILFFLLCGELGHVLAQQRPNIVVIFVDDMGFADPSCFGNPAMKTPQIDRLAAEGLKLTNFYVNSPICSASRVALTTGQYQQRFRIHSYFAGRKANRDRKMPDWLDPEAQTLARILKRNGYHTAHFGKWHMGGGRDVDDAPLPQAYGFDESLVSFEGLGDRILFHKKNASWSHGRGKVEGVEKHETSPRYADRTIDFIERHQNEPFYVRFFPNDVHDAHLPSDDQLAKWKDTSKNPPDEKFFAVLDALDQQIGRILDTLDRLKLTDSTLVMFTSDNGPTDWPNYYRKKTTPPGFTGPLFGRKWSLYEGGIRMPFIVRWPGKVPAGTTDDKSLMCAIDWLPTVAKLTDCELPDSNFDGEDRSSVLLGSPSKRTSPIFWEYGVHGSIKPGKKEHRSPQLAMREDDWKLLCNPDGSEAKLFNLKLDIGEKNNLASMREPKLAAMKDRLLGWWDEMAGYYKNQ